MKLVIKNEGGHFLLDFIALRKDDRELLARLHRVTTMENKLGYYFLCGNTRPNHEEMEKMTLIGKELI